MVVHTTYIQLAAKPALSIEKSQRTRSWNNQSVKSIITDMHAPYAMIYDYSHCVRSSHTYDYIVQYQQSDYDF